MVGIAVGVRLSRQEHKATQRASKTAQWKAEVKRGRLSGALRTTGARLNTAARETRFTLKYLGMICMTDLTASLLLGVAFSVFLPTYVVTDPSLCTCSSGVELIELAI